MVGLLAEALIQLSSPSGERVKRAKGTVSETFINRICEQLKDGVKLGQFSKVELIFGGEVRAELGPPASTSSFQDGVNKAWAAKAVFEDASTNEYTFDSARAYLRYNETEYVCTVLAPPEAVSKGANERLTVTIYIYFRHEFLDYNISSEYCYRLAKELTGEEPAGAGSLAYVNLMDENHNLIKSLSSFKNEVIEGGTEANYSFRKYHAELEDASTDTYTVHYIEGVTSEGIGLGMVAQPTPISKPSDQVFTAIVDVKVFIGGTVE